MTNTITFTIEDNELAFVAIQAIAKHLCVSVESKAICQKEPKPLKAWVSTSKMAKMLGISIRTIHHYRSKKSSPWQMGRHYKRSTPSDKSPWVWEPDLTLKAWAENNK